MKVIHKKILFISIVVSLCLLVVYLYSNMEERYFNKINIERTNFVTNKTDMKYIDTIIYVGLKNLNLTGINIIVFPLTDKMRDNFDDKFQLKGQIRGNEKQYAMWIDNIGRSEAIKVISHELIHLKQYNSEELTVNRDSIFWKGKIVNILDYSYESRPWEIDAFSKGDSLANKNIKVLYGK